MNSGIPNNTTPPNQMAVTIAGVVTVHGSELIETLPCRDVTATGAWSSKETASER